MAKHSMVSTSFFYNRPSTSRVTVFDEAEAAGGGPPNAQDDGVMVLARERVGPFDITLQSDDPRDWWNGSG